jgi:hypothetical protein
MGRGCFSLPPPDILPEPVSQLGIDVPKVLNGSDLKRKGMRVKRYVAGIWMDRSPE